MSKARMLERLKGHWGISNTFQVLLILVVFSLAGFSTLFVHKQINALLGIDHDSNFWLRLLVFIFLILPLYTLILYGYGLLLGQRKFFTRFIQVKFRLLFKGREKTSHDLSGQNHKNGPCKHHEHRQSPP